MKKNKKNDAQLGSAKNPITRDSDVGEVLDLILNASEAELNRLVWQCSCSDSQQCDRIGRTIEMYSRDIHPGGCKDNQFLPPNLAVLCPKCAERISHKRIVQISTPDGCGCVDKENLHKYGSCDIEVVHTNTTYKLSAMIAWLRQMVNSGEIVLSKPEEILEEMSQ